MRPAIDPLFRSAAVAFTSRVIGVILSGLLDDGTAGLSAIKRCSGLTMVQCPEDAPHKGMPESALANVEVDFCLSVLEMGTALSRLSRQPAGDEVTVPKDILTEARIAERVARGLVGLSALAFLLGIAPLIVYNLQTGGTFKSIGGNLVTSYYGTNNLALLSNLLERLSREIKRRTHVVGIFPNEASCSRLISAFLMEKSEAWLTSCPLGIGRMYLNFEGSEESVPSSSLS